MVKMGNGCFVYVFNINYGIICVVVTCDLLVVTAITTLTLRVDIPLCCLFWFVVKLVIVRVVQVALNQLNCRLLSR